MQTDTPSQRKVLEAIDLAASGRVLQHSEKRSKIMHKTKKETGHQLAAQ